MFKLEIARRHLTSQQFGLVHRVSKFCISKFLNNEQKLEDILKINIRCIKESSMTKNDAGYTYYASPTSFWIRFCKGLSDDALIDTIIHEFIHIKQYARGKLKAYTRNDEWYFLWDGISYGKIETVYEIHPTITDLKRDAPWEKEAYNRSVILIKEFKRL